MQGDTGFPIGPEVDYNPMTDTLPNSIPIPPYFPDGNVLNIGPRPAYMPVQDVFGVQPETDYISGQDQFLDDNYIPESPGKNDYIFNDSMPNIDIHR